MFSNPSRKRKQRGQSEGSAPKRPARESNPSRKHKKSATGVPIVSAAKSAGLPATDSKSAAQVLDPEPELDLAQVLKRVTFADSLHQRSASEPEASPPASSDDGSKHSGAEGSDGDDSGGNMAPSQPSEAEADTGWMWKPGEKKGPIWQRYCIGSKSELSLYCTANRTMFALLHDRDQDVTRNIVLNGDSGADRVKYERSKQSARLTNLRLWPSVDYYRYLGSERIRRYQKLGIDPLQPPLRFGDMWLEEPGAEWDTHQLHFQFTEPNADQTGTSDADVDLANPAVNGGIGLVLQKQPSITGGSQTVQSLTKQQLLHPELSAPRYTQVPMPDEFRSGHPVDLTGYQALVDLTRAQVLSRIVHHSPRVAGSSRLPLSSFVSETVATTAVSGILQTWKQIQMQRLDSRLGAACAFSTGSQWVAVLQAGLAAGLPPEVVASAFYRLENLCDLVIGKQATQLATTLRYYK